MNAHVKNSLFFLFMLLSDLSYGGQILHYGDAVNNKIIAQGFSADPDPYQAEKKATMDAVSEVSDYFSGIKIKRTEDYRKEFNVILKENLVIIIKKRSDDNLRIHFKKKKVVRSGNGVKVTIEVSPETSGSVLMMKNSIYLINNGFNSLSCERSISESACERIKNNFIENNDIANNKKSKLGLVIDLKSKVNNTSGCEVITAGKAYFYSGGSCRGNLNYQFIVKALGEGVKNTVRIINGVCKSINLDNSIVKDSFPSLIADESCKIYTDVKIII